MELQNQNNKNLVSNIKQLSDELQRDGKDPKQIVMNMLRTGKISQADFENAKRFAESKVGLFNK